MKIAHAKCSDCGLSKFHHIEDVNYNGPICKCEEPSDDYYFKMVGNEAKLFHQISILQNNLNGLRTRLANSIDKQVHLDIVTALKAEKNIIKSYNQVADDYTELRKKHFSLCELVIRAILEFQWVTNGIKMNENQHIRLGDTICELHDALAEYEKIKGDKG